MGIREDDMNGVSEQFVTKEHKHKHKKHKHKHKHKEKKREQAEQESPAPLKAEGAGIRTQSACDSEPESGEICAADDVDASVAERSGEDKPENTSKAHKANNGTLQQDEQATEEIHPPTADVNSSKNVKHSRDALTEKASLDTNSKHAEEKSGNVVQQLVDGYDDYMDDAVPMPGLAKNRHAAGSDVGSAGELGTANRNESFEQVDVDRGNGKHSHRTPEVQDAAGRKPHKSDRQIDAGKGDRRRTAPEQPSSSLPGPPRDDHLHQADRVKSPVDQRIHSKDHRSRGGEREDRRAGDRDKFGREGKREDRQDKRDRGLRERSKDGQEREQGYRERPKDQEGGREGYSDRSRGVSERGNRPDESRHVDRNRERDREHDRGRGQWGRERERNGRDYRDRERERREGGGRGYKRSRSKERQEHVGSGRSSKKQHNEEDAKQMEVDDDIPVLLEVNDEEEEARRIEESRRRRQEILAKYQQQQQQQQQQESTPPAEAPAGEAATQPSTTITEPGTPGPTSGVSTPAHHPHETPPKPTTPSYFAPEGTPEGERDSDSEDENADGPVLDIWAPGEARGDEAISAPPSAVPKAEEPSTAQQQLIQHAVQAEKVVVEEEDDMFAVKDDEDVGLEGAVAAAAAPEAVKRTVQALANDSHDDADGYYNFQVGEVMNDRYEVFNFNGKGVFSTVLRARDTLGRRDEQGNPQEVAIKMIRNNETMYKQAQLELTVLKQLAASDSDNRKHCIRFLTHFEYRSHMCLVFEPMDMNLRELTNKYGRNVGLNIKAVGLYASQLLVALRHMRKCNVLHADIKPDNILVNQRRTKVKICDFGSAMFYGKDNEITPFLVSRFYRPPEVILGLKYDFAMDIWSIGCVLYELFSGKILFPGRTNNEMLKLMMDIKGPLNKKMLRKGQCTHEHFDDNLSFIYLEEDPVTKQEVRREVPNPSIKHNFTTLLARSAETDKARVSQLADLLERMFTVDPEKRIDPDAALRHPFVREYLPRRKDGSGPAVK